MGSLAFSAPCPTSRLSNQAYSSHTRQGSVYCSTFTNCPNFPKRRLLSLLPVKTSKSHAPFREAPKASSTSSTSTNEETPQQPALDRFRIIRKVLLVISCIGAAETLYLTFNKLFSSPGAICATQGCLDVLSGPFSTFLGIPLTLFGALAYSIFAYLSVWPLAADDETDSEGELVRSAKEVYVMRDAATRPLMLALSTAMMVFSFYLMGLLVFVIQSMCPYCVVSAIISSSMFILTAFVGRAVPSVRDALRVGTGSAGIALVVAAGLFFLGMPAHIRAQPPGEPQLPPEITMRSTSDTLRIAGKLNLKKTKMYGAYWCSHCFDQKQRFGKKAFSKIEYIECDKHGANSQYRLCRDKRIAGYPTWEINGEMYPGEIEIPELERLADESGK